MFGRGNEEQLVDEPLQAPALLQCHVEQLRALFVGHPPVEPVERVHGTEHHCERGPQLVRHGGDEVALLPVEVHLPGQRDLALFVQEGIGRRSVRRCARTRRASRTRLLAPALATPSRSTMSTTCTSFSCTDDTTTALARAGVMRSTSGAAPASTS